MPSWTVPFEITTPDGGPAWQGENSDVLPAGSVAVAVTNRSVSPTGRSVPASRCPLPSVVRVTLPRKWSPSPLPEPSHSGTPKYSIRYWVLARASSAPAIVVVPASVVTLDSTGKLRRVFAPVATSGLSFAVTPSASRSMPSPSALPAFTPMSLPRIRLPEPLPAASTMPASLFWIVLPSPAPVPPIVVFDTPAASSTPGPVLPAPKLPIPFERIVAPFAPTLMPAAPLKPIEFAVSAAPVAPTTMPLLANDWISRPFTDVLAALIVSPFASAPASEPSRNTIGAPS